MLYNVKDFGAKGNGTDKDTAYIQAAIDSAAQNGGGTIYVPAGKYICGTIMLRDNITLELENGAQLFASNDPKDFTYAIDFPHNTPVKKDWAFRETRFLGLLCCHNVKNVTLRGGLLASDDISYYEKKDVGDEKFEPAMQAPAWYLYKVIRERVSMILCKGCDNLRVEDMRLESYPGYAAWFVGCDYVHVNGIATKGRKDLINTDGFHFSNCTNVMVSSSYFECGDDCLAFDAGESGNSHDITVTNCIFNTSVHAVRVFTGIDGRAESQKRCVKNVSISACTVTDAAGILNINAQDGVVENVTMSDICATLDAEGTAFLISTQNGNIHNIRINGFTVKGNGCGMIHAENMGDISRIRISDCEFVITPKTKLHAQFELMPLVFPRHCHFFPIAFHFERAKDIRVTDLRLTWTAPQYSDSWEPARKEAFIKRIAPKDISIMEPHHLKAFKLIDCENIEVINSVCPDFDYCV